MSELIRLRIRVYVENEIYSDETFEHTMEEFSAVLPKLAQKHADLSLGRPTMIEIEFLDEPDEQHRFFRLGTDPSRMVEPIEIDPKLTHSGVWPNSSN